jgi:Serine incorporator (Serinc)
MLIDVFYLWGQNWIAKYEAGNEVMASALIGTSLILYGAAFVLLVFNFIWYNGCGENVFSNVFTLFIIVGITAV